MIKITFLGTGCMQPTKQRNHSAILFSYKGENLLFDCGEGTQRQFRFAGLKPARVTKLFITHWHGDHCFGIPGLISAMKADGCEGILEIYGPKGSKTYVNHMLKGFAYRSLINYNVIEVSHGKIVDTNDFMIHAHPLKHSVSCIGYSFIEKDKLRIDVKNAEKLGLKGEMLGRLQKGKNVTRNGKKILYKDVTYAVKGKRISYIADTVKCPGANKLAKGCDILISEGTHGKDVTKKKYMHLTIKDACEIATKGKVKKLIITHISGRYKESKEVLKEAKKYFKKVQIAEDLMVVEI
ncbi:ribonuclease Z [Candidatus Woesearchaeota archaeon CG10_big_fil_rev_8_21_14_0_10_32_24]|nr:MAG: ribonuclease Z [Candidatus Woesearchaeota archaeon CG10_big_fil_rev_8_21_14_0_10_32_24]